MTTNVHPFSARLMHRLCLSDVANNVTIHIYTNVDMRIDTSKYMTVHFPDETSNMAAFIPCRNTPSLFIIYLHYMSMYISIFI